MIWQIIEIICMNDIYKNRIRRLIGKCGIRISRASSLRYAYDRENYPSLSSIPTPVIFDIGANIGQSTLWYLKSFPAATVYAFEPLPSVYKTLTANVGTLKNVICIQKAVGGRNEAIYIPSINSDTIQTVQVLGIGGQSNQSDVKIEVLTIDRFVDQRNIPVLDIIKTDTEGYDLDVLKGAAGILKQQRVKYVLSEVSIHEGDSQHTNLFVLRDFLKVFGYSFCSFFDGYHDENGRIPYFNALFQAGD